MAEPIDNSNSNSNSNKEINNGSTESINENNSNNDEENKKKNKKVDPEIFSCLLQPMTSDSGPHYIGIRRLLLFRKAHSGVHRRLDWRSNRKGYVTFVITFAGQEIGTVCQATKALRETVDDGFNLRVHSPICSRWTAGLPARTSFSSTASDNDSLRCRGAEPAYSFVGMHCIFDQCKAAVTVLKFGYMSSDLLAYGASDGTLTVCTVTEPPSVIKKLEGHSKDVTDFDFSSNNQYIASASMDKTVRGWELPKGICIRVIYGVSSQLCIRFLILYSISALAGLLINWCLMIRLLLWTVITLVTSFSVGMHRNVYTPQAWTHKQVRCFGLIAIEVVARANIKLQQYGTGVSLC